MLTAFSPSSFRCTDGFLVPRVNVSAIECYVVITIAYEGH